MATELYNFISEHQFQAAVEFVKTNGEAIPVTDDDERPNTYIEAQLLHSTSGQSSSSSFRQRGPDGKYRKINLTYNKMLLFR